MISEKEFEDILCKYPELIEDGLNFKGRQIHLYGRRMDIVFVDRFNRTLIIELKIGPIKDEHIGQILSYEGILLSAENPTIRVMLIGNRVPPNIRISLDHHGIAWKELSISFLKDFLSQKNDLESLKFFEEQYLSDNSKILHNKSNLNSDLVGKIYLREDEADSKKLKHQIVWEKQFNYLVQYRKEHPDSWPKQLEEFPAGNRLGLWCLTQRNAYKQGRLSQDRIKLLSSMSFVFVALPHQDAWDRQFDNLIQFRNEFPDRWPLTNEEYPDGNYLGGWLSRQRYLYNKKKMLPENYEKLNQLGLNFNYVHSDTGFDYSSHGHKNIEEFFKQNIEIDTSGASEITKERLYRNYVDWCRTNGTPAMGNNKFGALVYAKYSKYTPKNTMSHMLMKRVWKNLKFIGANTSNEVSPVELFFKEHVQVCVEDGIFIEKGELYEKYKEWTKRNSCCPLNTARFAQFVFLKYSSVTPKNTCMAYKDRPTKRIWRNLKYVNQETNP